MFIEHLEGRRLLSGVKFVAPLLGSTEVPAVVTPAKGVAKFVLSRDGAALRYSISAKRITNAMGAHIHLGQPTEIGTIVADLMSGTMHMGKKGFSARGVITAAQLSGTLAGHSLADLVAQMNAGGAYVNVHTDDGAEPHNTAPGDYPDGEIRGQIHRIVKKVRTAGDQSAGGSTSGSTGGTTGGTTGGATGGSTGGTAGGSTGGSGGGIYGSGMYGGGLMY
jgi:hypothetical protein